MAKCEDCRREMRLAPSSIEAPMLIARRDYIRLRHPASETRRCYDCNVKPGGVHHGGCEEERCPRCGGQLIMCPCRGKRFRQLREQVEAGRFRYELRPPPGTGRTGWGSRRCAECTDVIR